MKTSSVLNIAACLRAGVILITAVGVLLAVVVSTRAIVRRRVALALEQRAAASAALHVAVLRSEIERQRGLPLVLSDDAQLKAALAHPSPQGLQALNRKLQALGAEVGSKVVYALNQSGMTVSASNWNRPDSFVGSNYSFRPYFIDAMREGAATYFAQGTVSRHPGLYLAQRVSGPRGPLGAVVVKVEFDALESSWRSLAEPVYVVNADGVVLITSVSDWRFRTLGALDPALLRRLREGRQFDHAPFTPLPLRRDRAQNQVFRTDLSGARGQALLDQALPLPEYRWTLHLLTPLAQADQAAQSAAWIGVLVAVLCGVIAVWIWRRRRHAATVAEAAEANRHELERRVAARTEQLTAANTQLVAEVEERKRTEIKLTILQSELVQANKLASLGQIAAGVAHEINQPVSAIRTYADNAIVLLDRGLTDEARSNLGVIGAMTERVGIITDELRAFARKATGRIEPTSVAEAVEGSLLLTVSRVRQHNVQLIRKGLETRAEVYAERVRLEQVLVNLLQNAFEAVEGMEQGVITVSIQSRASTVRISIRDNGPGLTPETLQNLFIPFATTKPRGLGLGLVIARDIVADFGGRLIAKNAASDGALFIVVLRKVILTGTRRWT